jgi:ABC-type sugar transport systems, permease components
VVPRGARNVEGAWDFIKFATSPEARMTEAAAQRAWEHMRGRLYLGRIHGMPAVNEALIRKYGGLPERFLQGWKTHIDLMPRTDTRPVTVIGQTLWDEHVRAYERYVTDELSLTKALRQSEERAQRELDQYFYADRHPVVPGKLLATIAGAVCVALACVILWSGSGARMKGLRRQENRWAYLFISPWLLGLLVLTLGPLVASFALSFTQWDVIGPVRWVGLSNYQDLLGPDVENTGKAFSNILFLCLIGVPLSVCTSLSLALLLNAYTRGIGAFRTLFYLPSIVPAVASTVLWAWLLNPDPARGLVNRLWAATIQNWFHFAPPGWFASSEWSKPGLIVMGLWGAGGGIILWLAGLKGIPRDLYEAAELDGASAAQAFYRVTLPMLSPVIFFSLVVGFIGAFQEFDRIYVLVPPDQRYGVHDSLLVPMVYLFEHGFARFRMGYASAIAWLIFLVLAVVTWLQFRFGERRVFYEASR